MCLSAWVDMCAGLIPSLSSLLPVAVRNNIWMRISLREGSVIDQSEGNLPCMKLITVYSVLEKPK